MHTSSPSNGSKRAASVTLPRLRRLAAVLPALGRLDHPQRIDGDAARSLGLGGFGRAWAN